MTCAFLIHREQKLETFKPKDIHEAMDKKDCVIWSAFMQRKGEKIKSHVFMTCAIPNYRQGKLETIIPRNTNEAMGNMFV